MSGLAVVTVAHGRPDHLAAQEATLSASGRDVDIRVQVTDGGPNVGAARNLGARRALEQGARTLVFLDVDCLVAPDTLRAYEAAVLDRPDVVWSGPVTYLSAVDRPYPLDDLTRLDAPHPARPAPVPGEALVAASPADDHWELFWSLSFALSADAWQRTGGFDEAYTGYGAEDTDLGQRARAAGLRHGWLGDARAYHQHHPTQDPPVQHLADILRNGRVFRDRWGWWPMQGWLAGFERLGLVEQVDDDWRAR